MSKNLDSTNDNLLISTKHSHIVETSCFNKTCDKCCKTREKHLDSMIAGIKTNEDKDVLTTVNYRPQNFVYCIADEFLLIEQEMCQQLGHIEMPDIVKYAYCSLYYAFTTHYNFIQRYCNTKRDILFLGMNPGPFGMSQNGVPFGEASIVRDWLEIKGVVYKPSKEHPKRLIEGLQCRRKEVSGARFWGLFHELLDTPERFFQYSFVTNHCPCAFMTEKGRNVTPPQLPSATMRQINAICDEGLRRTASLLDAKVIVCIGKYARDCADRALSGSRDERVKVVTMMHPSPRNPTANRGWADVAKQQLHQAGVLQLILDNTCNVHSAPIDA